MSSNVTERDLLILNPDCSLKKLKEPHIYNKCKDALYRIDKEAECLFQENETITGDMFVDCGSRDFFLYCLEEEILIPSEKPSRRTASFIPAKGGITDPALRYLLFHITDGCNISCKHCYLGKTQKTSLGFKQIRNVFKEMEEMQGLIVLLSGGEPLCHPSFWEINEILPEFNLRFELLTNGTLITPEVAKRLKVHQVQVSIDGLETAHDFMRGSGNFKRSLNGIRNLVDAGMKVAVSTMVFAKNLQDFEGLQSLLRGMGVEQWLVNSPSAIGSWVKHEDLSVDHENIAEKMITYSQADGPHESKYSQICGSHICTIFADGEIYPCPLIVENSLRMGNIRDGLASAWQKKKSATDFSDFSECGECTVKHECHGGCRFRAKESGNPCGRDPVMCAIYKKRRRITPMTIIKLKKTTKVAGASYQPFIRLFCKSGGKC